jgi:hypothetical protein
MPQFAPDQCAFKDIAGYGAYDTAHAREHLQFVQTYTLLASEIPIPAYDFQQFLTGGQARQSIMLSHYQTHLLLRAPFGIEGVDLTAFNLDSEDDFYSFLGYHSQEHILIRQQLGII